MNAITFLKRTHADEMKLSCWWWRTKKNIWWYTKTYLIFFFLDSRYNLHYLPYKIKKKLLSKNSLYQRKTKAINFTEKFDGNISYKKKKIIKYNNKNNKEKINSETNF